MHFFVTISILAVDLLFFYDNIRLLLNRIISQIKALS